MPINLRKLLLYACIAGCAGAVNAEDIDMDIELDCEEISLTSQIELNKLQTYVEQVDGQLSLVKKALAASEVRQQEQVMLIEKLRRELQQFRAQQPDIREKLNNQVFAELANILPDSPIYNVGSDYVRLLGDSIFELADDQLSTSGSPHLLALVAALKTVSLQLPTDIYWRWQVQVHTDNKEISSNSKFANHWALSAARAASIARYMESKGLPGHKIHASALANTRLLEPGTGRRISHWRNRRLEIRLILEK